MNSKSFDYLTHVEEILERVKNTQWESMDACAGKMAEAIAGGHSVFAFGASHAGILAQELFYRTGGLAVLNAILPSEFMLNTRPVTQTSTMEKLDGYPTAILKHTPIHEGDVLLLHSVSGRRHKSGKKLYEVCDIVIDNCGDFEDSSMLLPGMNQKIGPTSSVVGCTIVNMIVIRTVEHLQEMGIEPPIFHSANVDGGEEFNNVLFEKYKDQIHYM